MRVRLTMGLIECVGNLYEALAIASLSLAIACQYLLITQVWKAAQKKYGGRNADNPWFIMRMIFIFCGICGYFFTFTSIFAPVFSYAAKLVVLVALFIFNILFLRSSAHENFLKSATEAKLGQKSLSLYQQVRDGQISSADAHRIIKDESEALLKLYG